LVKEKGEFSLPSSPVRNLAVDQCRQMAFLFDNRCVGKRGFATEMKRMMHSSQLTEDGQGIAAF